MSVDLYSHKAFGGTTQMFSLHALHGDALYILETCITLLDGRSDVRTVLFPSYKKNQMLPVVSQVQIAKNLLRVHNKKH